MTEYLPYILVMAVVTYLIRMLPLTFFHLYGYRSHAGKLCRLLCGAGTGISGKRPAECCGSVLYYGISGSLYLLKQAGGSRAPVQKPALFFNADSCISTNAPRNRIPSFCLCDPASLYFCI